MRVVWCNRYGQRRERLPGAPDLEIRTLAELPALLGCQTGREWPVRLRSPWCNLRANLGQANANKRELKEHKRA